MNECDSNFKEALKHLQKNKETERKLVRAFIVCSYIISAGVAAAVIFGGAPFIYDYFTDKICKSESYPEPYSYKY